MASKSLGTLTIDLVAKVGGFVQGMDKASRESAKWRKQVEKDAKTIGTAVGAASAAALTGLVALTASTVKSATEVSRFAAISGAGAEEFQRYAAAADMVGISQEKLSDQLKDFNEKVGEFQQSGGGGMKDFFEQIAPQIGITAEAFRDLSGPQALQLYYDSLDKAGLNQKQMSFYLESMASDTTALIPLLRDGGAGFKLLGDEAERAGSILSEDTISAADKMSAAIFVAENAMKGFRNDISSKLLPVLGDLAIEFSDVATEGAIAEDVGSVLASTTKGLAAAAVGAFAALQLLGRGIAGVAVVGGKLTETEWYEKIIPPLLYRRIYKNWDEAKGALEVVGDDLDDTTQRYATLLDGIWNSGNGGEADANSTIERIAKLREEMSKLENSGSGAGGSGAISAEAKKAADAISSQVEALQKQADTLGMSAEALALYNLEQAKATDAQLLQARVALDAISAFEKQKEQQEAYKDLVAELRTEEEQLTEQMRERLAVLDAMQGIEPDERMKVAGRIAGAATSDAPEFGGLDASVGGPFGELLKIDEAEEKLQEWYDTQLEMLEQFRQDRADLSAVWDEEELALKQQHEDELARIEQARQTAQLASAESIFGDLAGMARTFAGENSGIYKTMFAVQKAAAIAQSMVAIQTGIALAAANPFPANLAAMASVAAATASIVGNIGAIGMAHDGIDSIPETGTWILEKGERVTTAETSAKLDKTLSDIQQGNTGGAPIVNLYEDSSKAGQVNSRNDDGRNVIDIFVSDIMGDGRAQKAISQKFGLQGVGR